MSTYEDQLRKRLDETFAPGWQPKAGDTIAGVVERMSTSTEGEYGSYPIITVRRIINGNVVPERVAIHCFHTSLKRALEREYPERGMVVMIRCNGRQTNERTGREFESYDYTLDPHPPRELVEEAARLEAVSVQTPADEPF